MKVLSLFLKNSTSLEETDTKTVTVHCHKNSEMRAGDVKKGGICSWSYRLDRGVFGRWERQAEEHHVQKQEVTPAITLLTPLSSK